MTDIRLAHLILDNTQGWEEPPCPIFAEKYSEAREDSEVLYRLVNLIKNRSRVGHGDKRRSCLQQWPPAWVTG